MKKITGKIRAARAAFTLMEVNLAVFIMAVGVLAMTALYPLGFRESQQAREDVLGAIVANEVLGKLTAALSSRDITWNDWKKIEDAVALTPKGWFDYLEKKSSGSSKGEDKYGVRSRSVVTGKARGVFEKLAGVNKSDTPTCKFDEKYAYGLVAQWGKRILATGPGKSISVDDYSRVSISFRMARRSGALMAAPLYYTEVHFQGDQEKKEQ